jgi:hypothetical protein
MAQLREILRKDTDLMATQAFDPGRTPAVFGIFSEWLLQPAIGCLALYGQSALGRIKL